MEGVGADAEMESILAGVLDEVLVGANTGGLEGLGAQLLILVGDEVDAEREVVDGSTLAAEIEDANLGVRDTTVEARLGVRLQTKMLASCLRTVFGDVVVILRPSSSPEFPCVMRHSFTTGCPSKRLFRRSARSRFAGDKIHFKFSPCSCSSGSNERDGGPSCRISGELSVKWLLVTGEERDTKREEPRTLSFGCATRIDFKALLGNLDRWCYRLNRGPLGLTPKCGCALIGSRGVAAECEPSPHYEILGYQEITAASTYPISSFCSVSKTRSISQYRKQYRRDGSH